MADLDLTKQTRRIIAERWNMSRQSKEVREDADAILAVAVPLIAAQVREQVAQEIKTARDDIGTGSLSDDPPFARGMRAGMTSGCRIAREGLREGLR